MEVVPSVALHAKEMEGHQGRRGVFHLGGFGGAEWVAPGQ